MDFEEFRHILLEINENNLLEPEVVQNPMAELPIQGEIDVENDAVEVGEQPLVVQEEPQKKKNLLLPQKWRICVEVAARIRRETGELTKHCLDEIILLTGYCRSTIREIWKVYVTQRGRPFEEMVDLLPKKAGHCGRRKRDDSDEIKQAIKAIVNQAGDEITYRAINSSLYQGGYEVSLGTVHKYCHEMNVHEICNVIKPQLTEEGKMKRLRWVLQFIVNTPEDGLMFDPLYDYVYLDEKNFILEKIKRLLKRFEDSPPETFNHIQSKRNPTQVMCTAVIGRPRNSDKSDEYFDGLLTFMPHVNWVPAKRNSQNRPRGTL